MWHLNKERKLLIEALVQREVHCEPQDGPFTICCNHLNVIDGQERINAYKCISYLMNENDLK